jgi:hypothetical protein
MSPGVHFGSGEGSAERLRGVVAGVRFLSFSRSIRSIFRTSAGRSICGGTWYFASGEGSTEGLGGPGARFVNFSRSVGSSFRIPAGNSRRRFRQSGVRLVGSVVVCVEVFGTAQWHNLLVRGRFRRRSRRLRCRAR